MFSLLRKGLVYQNVSSDIVEQDLDVDAEQWSYSERDVYRGNPITEYLKYNLNVYWLYDDNSMRVGLAEHELDSDEIFRSLWFFDNPFATLTQDERWKSTEKTFWSLLSNEAYQDCLENDFKNVEDLAIQSGVLLMTPKRLIEAPSIYECETCGKKTLSGSSNCLNAKISVLDASNYSICFLDDDFVIHKRITEPRDALHEEPSAQQEQKADRQESVDVQTPQPREEAKEHRPE